MRREGSRRSWGDQATDALAQHGAEVMLVRTHGRSKLANALFTVELARRLVGPGVTARCVPGYWHDRGHGQAKHGIVVQV